MIGIDYIHDISCIIYTMIDHELFLLCFALIAVPCILFWVWCLIMKARITSHYNLRRLMYSGGKIILNGKEYIITPHSEIKVHLTKIEIVMKHETVVVNINGWDRVIIELNR